MRVSQQPLGDQKWHPKDGRSVPASNTATGCKREKGHLGPKARLVKCHDSKTTLSLPLENQTQMKRNGG